MADNNLVNATLDIVDAQGGEDGGDGEGEEEDTADGD